ncbi:MAG TPA: argininosuccinate lyase [Candidatus Omnitrophota bacterium]|nr:argininosuccinate lyase [Candidatus Omnitrophota bacterium]HPD85340.1 argininosuccinate lyase [Candidatus Omnitrophota bacterium]HRZ04159.1 argininosuccinate lyase [Candidatus Omnitrophota bacterium]
MAKKLWGGRFSKKTDPLVEEFTKSIQIDKTLAQYDCWGSILHINVLKKAKLLTPEEHEKLEKGLNAILKYIESDEFEKDPSLNDFEDIHSYIQNLIEKKVPGIALKLHTCRSRNDQVVFCTKLYSLDHIKVVQKFIMEVDKSLLKLAVDNAGVNIPGYTHLQHAMPINLFEYFYAYHEMLNRDLKRLSNIYKTINLTLGAGALAGTFIKSKEYNSAVKLLLLSKDKIPVKPTTSAIDTVSDRDFVIEILSAISILGLHLSRLSEDLIIWSTKEFDFIEIDESFCTGSSLMPQKRNPDVLELIRGYAGKLYGNLISVLVTMKGLPLTYNRDMQLDKEPLFNSFTIIQQELKVLSHLLLKIKFNETAIKKQLSDECLYATDISDFLVKNGVTFKEAHTIVGQLISYKLKHGISLLPENEMEKGITDEELKKFHPLLSIEVMKRIIDPYISVKNKKSLRRKLRIMTKEYIHHK